MATLRPDVQAALQHAAVDGQTLRLTTQLDPGTFTALGQMLRGWGGSYRAGKDRRYVFPADVDVAGLVDQAASTGTRIKAAHLDGYFATPGALADQIVTDHTRIGDALAGDTVLEPSAGDGALVRAIRRAHGHVLITAVEPNQARADRIPLDGLTGVHTMTIERYAAQAAIFARAGEHGFDAVLMNPPFALPGQPTAWIDHVNTAYKLLAPGGQLTAIVPGGFTFRDDRRHAAIRDLVADRGDWRELPAGSFKAAGTDVLTCLLWIGK